VGRLDNIVTRNRRPHWSRNPVVHAIAVGVILIIVLVLVAFTDLAQPRHAAHPRPDAGAPTHVDGVLLRSFPTHDAGPSRAADAAPTP